MAPTLNVLNENSTGPGLWVGNARRQRHTLTCLCSMMPTFSADVAKFDERQRLRVLNVVSQLTRST
jgi:hypothetical protein